MLPNPEDYPEFDPVLLKCIGYLNMGGKEARRGLKELYAELSERVSPISANHKSDKRKGTVLEKDPSKKARIDETELPKFTEDEKSSLTQEQCSLCPIQPTAKNQLIDCNECHQWFHQNCQQPPVPAKVLADRASDTRFVWKCAECSHLINKMKEPKKNKETAKVKEINAQPFNRANTKITNIKETSRSREGSPGSMGGWAGLAAKSEKPKKEKKLSSFDMFGDQPTIEPIKKKKEVNPSAIKALKEKERKKREGSHESSSSNSSSKSSKKSSRDEKASDKIASMKKKSAEKQKLKAAAKRV